MYMYTNVPVSERSDDKSGRVSEVLVAIGQLRVDHTCHDVLLLPVVAHLTQPVEVCLTGYLCGYSIQKYTYMLYICM